VWAFWSFDEGRRSYKLGSSLPLLTEVRVPRGGERERERGRSPLPCRLVPCCFSPPFPASACASDLAGKSPFFHSVGVLLPENSILGFRGKKRVRLNFGLAVVYSVPVALHVDCDARRCHMRIYCGWWGGCIFLPFRSDKIAVVKAEEEWGS
jgi:hypothetical protein